MQPKFYCSLLAALLLTSLVGCGDGLARVEGVVTFNGEPVSRGFINLEPVDGKGTVSGASVEDGKFIIEDVIPGDKIVRLSAVYTKGIQKNAEDGSEIELCEDLFPPEYGQGKKLKLTVVSPDTKAEFSVEGADPRKKKLALFRRFSLIDGSSYYLSYGSQSLERRLLRFSQRFRSS